MVEHELGSFPTVASVALWILVTLLIKLIRIHLKWEYIQVNNYTILVAVSKARLFCLKRFAPVTRVGMLMWENFHSGSRDLGNRASLASPMSSWKSYTKERVARRDLENRANPIDRASSVRLNSQGIQRKQKGKSQATHGINGVHPMATVH